MQKCEVQYLHDKDRQMECGSSSAKEQSKKNVLRYCKS